MVGEVKRSVSPPVCPTAAPVAVPPPCRVRGAFMAGSAIVTSCAVVSPDARGDATAGGPEFGKRARRKSPRRTANRFLLKRALRKAEIPSLPRYLPCARALIVSHREGVCTWSNEKRAETLPRGVGRVS